MGEIDYVVAIVKILAFARVQAYSLMELDEKFAESVDSQLLATMNCLYERERELRGVTEKQHERPAA